MKNRDGLKRAIANVADLAVANGDDEVDIASVLRECADDLVTEEVVGFDGGQAPPTPLTADEVKRAGECLADLATRAKQDGIYAEDDAVENRFLLMLTAGIIITGPIYLPRPVSPEGES